MEKASKHTLELTFPTELEEYVTAEVQSGVLVLTLDLEKAPRDIRREFNSGDWKLYAKVSCPGIESVRLSGAANMSILDRFDTQSLDIRTGGASSLKKAAFNAVGDLKIVASGASHVEMDLSGNIDNSDIECSGASNVYIIGGNYTDCVVDNSGASDVDMEEVRMKNLRISLSGASNFYVNGTADYLDVDVSGASSCKASSLIAKRARVEASGASSVTVNAKDMDLVDVSRASSVRNRR